MTTTATPQNAWATKVQGRTLTEADAHREPWMKDDLEFVIEFTDTETDEALALSLGRSLFAIWAIQHRVRTEGVDAVMRPFVVGADKQRPLSSRTYTFIGDDVPPGWND